MEYLDIYDEFGKYIGKELRDVVHEKALWHKTVHCWLYDALGNVFFQIRKDTNTLYTTASGHLKAGETIEAGFEREIREEIGISIDASEAELVVIHSFVMDQKKKDGSMFRDRAFANVYVNLYAGDYQDFSFDPDEVTGLVLVNAKEVLSLFQKGSGSIEGTYINGANESFQREFDISEFLVNENETLLEKYGAILKKVIFLTQS